MSLTSLYEKNQIFNSLLEDYKKDKFPKGYVRSFDLNKKPKLMFEKSNLVTGLGREYNAQKIVTHQITDPGPSNLSLTQLPSGSNNWREYEITHYGFGGGGVNMIGIDDYELTGPNICDTNLYRPITYLNPSFLNDPGEIDELDGIHKSEQSVKPLNYGNNTFEYQLISYPLDSPDPSCEYLTQMCFTIFKEEGEFGCLDVGESVQVSEAGLYISNGIDARLFAHICFPPKFMEKEGYYGIEWYILC